MKTFRLPTRRALTLAAALVVTAFAGASASRAQSFLPAAAGTAGDAAPDFLQARRALDSAWRADVRSGRRPRNAAQQAAALAPVAAAAATSPAYTYFPTGSVSDGRFLVLAGTGLATLAGKPIDIELAAPRTETQLELGLFDGNSNGMWDYGNTPSRFTLYADPQGDGSGTTVVAQWSSDQMPDDAWFSATLPVGPEARAASGHYFYHLRAESTVPLAAYANNFKVRVRGTLALQPQAFATVAWVNTSDEVFRLYPAYPALSPTTYDGSWHFYLDVPAATRAVTVWDGDLDFGSADRRTLDTDDPDTPNGRLPNFAAASAECRGECVAVGYGTATGNPPEDYSSEFFVRAPAITYDLVDPSGVRYKNTNPSGNQEWEQFRVSTDVLDRTKMDLRATSLPKGIYDVNVKGMDITNVNAWYFLYDTVGVTSAGKAVTPLRATVIGDTVWLDSNGNGVQDNGEAGLANVVVSLKDGSGKVIESTVTDANGNYLFDVKGLTVVEGGNGPEVVVDGVYTVEIAASNFNAGSALANYAATTGALSRTETVLQANILTDDFGFRPATAAASLGDRVWLDSNANGVQDSGEAGLGGVTLRLLNASGAITATAVTAADGSYLFTGITPGTYSVQVVAPSGYLASPAAQGSSAATDSDFSAAGYSGTVTLASGEDNRTVDAGFYQLASLGDRVWLDANANGVQDGGETGLGGVTVKLLNAAGSGLGTAVTDASGFYRFPGLTPGSYRVQVVVPAGRKVSPAGQGTDRTQDSKIDASGLTGTVTLTSGAAEVTQDAGLYTLGSLGDRVWWDNNGNGLQDGAESGLAGVTVQLYLNGSLVASQKTAADGSYLFADLAAGSYTVKVDATTVPAGYAATYDLDGTTTAHSAAVTLAGGESRTDVDFGYDAVNNSGSFTTFTQGGWGAVPNGGNPGTVLHGNFATVFPNGVTIGGKYAVKFTTAQAVTIFLPQGGTADDFTVSAVDPTTSDAGVFAGQVLALQLNVSFSDAGITRSGLGAKVLATGKLAGYTVRQVLALANKAIGGEATALPAGVSIADLSSIVTALNENYDNGTVDKGYLK